MIAFIEILMFSIVCELLTIGSCGFFYFSLGMVAVIFHLVSTTRFKKALLQLIGILATFVIFYIDMTDYVPIKSIATFGLASGNDLMKYEQVINTADQMLYYGKNHGKNCIIKDIP